MRSSAFVLDPAEQGVLVCPDAPRHRHLRSVREIALQDRELATARRGQRRSAATFQCVQLISCRATDAQAAGRPTRAGRRRAPTPSPTAGDCALPLSRRVRDTPAWPAQCREAGVRNPAVLTDQALPSLSRLILLPFSIRCAWCRASTPLHPDSAGILPASNLR